jgi:hypothetical protein
MNGQNRACSAVSTSRMSSASHAHVMPMRGTERDRDPDGPRRAGLHAKAQQVRDSDHDERLG